MIHKKLMSGVFAVAIAFSLFVSGCDSDSYSGDADLESNIDSVSYAFGYLNGQQMGQQGMDDLKAEQFAAGMNEALNAEEDDSAMISQTEMMAMLRRYQMKAQQKQQEQQKQEADQNQQEGEEFLSENESKEGVQTTESGLQYRVITEGNGNSPTVDDTVVVNYTGTLIDGTEFDSRDSVSIALNRVFQGWKEGIPMMKEGASYKFWIPGDLAYGQNPPPNGPIGPNETLIFEVDLHEVK